MPPADDANPGIRPPSEVTVRPAGGAPEPVPQNAPSSLLPPPLFHNVPYWVLLGRAWPSRSEGASIRGRGTPVALVVHDGRFYSGAIIDSATGKIHQEEEPRRAFPNTVKIETPTGLRVRGEAQDVVYMTADGLGSWASQYRQAIANSGAALAAVKETVYGKNQLNSALRPPRPAGDGHIGYVMVQGVTTDGRWVVGPGLRTVIQETKIDDATVEGVEGVHVEAREVHKPQQQALRRTAPDWGVFAGGWVKIAAPGRGIAALEEVVVGYGYVADPNEVEEWTKAAKSSFGPIVSPVLSKQLASARLTGRLRQRAGRLDHVRGVRLPYVETAVAQQAFAGPDNLPFSQDPHYGDISSNSPDPGPGEGKTSDDTGGPATAGESTERGDGPAPGTRTPRSRKRWAFGKRAPGVVDQEQPDMQALLETIEDRRPGLVETLLGRSVNPDDLPVLRIVAQNVRSDAVLSTGTLEAVAKARVAGERGSGQSVPFDPVVAEAVLLPEEIERFGNAYFDVQQEQGGADIGTPDEPGPMLDR